MLYITVTHSPISSPIQHSTLASYFACIHQATPEASILENAVIELETRLYQTFEISYIFHINSSKATQPQFFKIIPV